MKTYLRHRISNVIDIKELIALEFLDFEGKYKNYVESHDFWELCYVESGEITLSIEEKSVILSENQLVLLSPNKTHSYSSENGNKNKVFVVCFDCFSQALTPISNAPFLPDNVQLDCMQRIIKECKASFYMNEKEHLEIRSAPLFGGQQALMLQLEYLLINLVRRMSIEKNSEIVFFSDENFYADLVKVMLRFLRENVHKKLTLHDICSKFNYSRSFLCKTFKKETGETLISYFNRMKMAEAQRMLSETTESIKNIAISLGFSEVKYFDTVFKSHTGMTPLAYREKAGNKSKTV